MELIFSKPLYPSETAMSQQINDETVILDVQSENYFGLDPVGSRIWELLQQAKLPEQIFDILLMEYEVSPDVLRTDIETLLQKLLEAGLLTTEAA